MCTTMERRKICDVVSEMVFSYEGLCREEVPHGKGSLVMGNGSGGGFQNAKPGDT